LISDKNNLQGNLSFYCDTVIRFSGVQTQPFSQYGVILHRLATEVIAGLDVSFSPLTIPPVAYTNPEAA